MPTLSQQYYTGLAFTFNWHLIGLVIPSDDLSPQHLYRGNNRILHTNDMDLLFELGRNKLTLDFTT